MATKIVIDAGHGGYDAGASYNGRREKDDVLALSLAVGEILAAQGYDIVYTRTEDVYDSPVQKAKIGNDSGADFFVSIHRNSSPTPNQYNGVQTLVYNNSGIKVEMATNINRRLEEVGYRNINVVDRPDLAVLRRTRMPAILVEAGFINSDKDNEIFDSKFSETAEAIARGIDETLRNAGYAAVMAVRESMGDKNSDYIQNEYYGYEMKIPKTDNEYEEEQKIVPVANLKTRNSKITTDGEKEYQILVGIYRNFGTASYQANRFINEGYEAEVYEDEELYQVRVGNYADIEDALVSQRELRDKGFDTLIVKKNQF